MQLYRTKIVQITEQQRRPDRRCVFKQYNCRCLSACMFIVAIAVVLTYLRFLNYELKSNRPGVRVCQYFNVTVAKVKGTRRVICQDTRNYSNSSQSHCPPSLLLLLLSVSIRHIPGAWDNAAAFPPFSTSWFIIVVFFSPIVPLGTFPPVSPSVACLDPLTVLSTAHLAHGH